MEDKNKTDTVSAEDVVGDTNEPVFGFPEKTKKPADIASVKLSPVELKGETPSPIGKQTLVTGMDSYLGERIKTQPKTLAEITAIGEPEKRPGKHRLSLPKQLEPYINEFAFRWILKDKRAIDEAIDKGWVFVNMQLFQKLPSWIFSIAGAIEKGDLVLACISKKKAEERTKEVQQRSSDMVNTQLRKHEEDKDVFYKPKLTPQEADNAEANPGDIQEGRDFGKPKEE